MSWFTKEQLSNIGKTKDADMICVCFTKEEYELFLSMIKNKVKFEETEQRDIEFSIKQNVENMNYARKRIDELETRKKELEIATSILNKFKEKGEST